MPKHRSTKVIHIAIRSQNSLSRSDPSITRISTTKKSVGTTEKSSINDRSLTTPKATLYANKVHVLRWNNTGITIIGNHRVQKFARGSKIGVTVAGSASGVPGTNLASFNQCTGIYVDENQNIYVSEYSNHRVMLWTPGSPSGIIVIGNGTAGNENNTLDRPHDIQRDSATGMLYVADSGNNRIMRYAPNTAFGTQVAGGNIGANNYTLINFAWGFYRDLLTDSFILANANGANIIRWHSGDTNWTQLAGILGEKNITSTTLKQPANVTIDPMDNLYVVDLPNHRIQLFLVGELIGTTIAGVTNQNGNNTYLFNYPSSIVLDNQLNFYVADYFNHRIQKFLRY